MHERRAYCLGPMRAELLAYQTETSHIVGLWAGTALILLGGALVAFSSALLIWRWSRRDRAVNDDESHER